TLNTGAAGYTGIVAGETLTIGAATGAFNSKDVVTANTVNISGIALADGTGLASNYNLTNTTASTAANITAKDITAVTGITVNNKTYDGNTAATLNTGAAGFSGALGGDILNVATATGNYTDKNAGTGKTVNITGLSLGGVDAANYNLTGTTASTTADIAARPITITTNPGQTKLAGSADPIPFTFVVGGLGLVGGDTLTGTLDRLSGEAPGNYAINQGSLDAGSNYAITYIGNPFSILVPSNISPSNNAGLGNLMLAINERPLQNLTILNLSATGAGSTVDTGNVTEACATSPEQTPNNPNTSVMFNFGIKLPKGVQSDCI
nr:hypothetical protein [Methylotenera sp.]